MGATLSQPVLVTVTLFSKSVPVKIAVTFVAASVVELFVIIMVLLLVPSATNIAGEPLVTEIGTAAALLTAI